MSYNVDSIEVLTWENVRMLKRDLRRLADTEKPGSNFLDEHAKQEADADGYVALDRSKFWWSSEWSGNSWEHFIKNVATKILGIVEAVVIWEEGDSYSGLRIRDGKVTEPKVVMALAEEED